MKYGECDTCGTKVGDEFIRCDACEEAFLKKYPFLDGWKGVVFGTLLGSLAGGIMSFIVIRLILS